MFPFGAVYPDLANEEMRVIHAQDNPNLPKGTFTVRESYCEEANCDCRRVLLNVHWEERDVQVATINYAFEPPPPPYEDEGQIFIDPLNPQSDLSPYLLEFVEAMIAADAAYRQRLSRHYDAFKRVVNDPGHADHGRLQQALAQAERPVITPFRRTVPKAPNANSPCPCGSGRRYKKCCKK